MDTETRHEIAEAVTEAIAEIGAARGRQFVRLHEVRVHIGWAWRAAQDEVLAEMFLAGKISLVEHSSPRMLNGDDRAAALHLGDKDRTLVALAN